MATQITSIERLLANKKKKKELPEDDLSKKIFDVIGKSPANVGYLCSKLKVDPGQIVSSLSLLEMAGAVQRQQGKWMKLTRQK